MLKENKHTFNNFLDKAKHFVSKTGQAIEREVGDLGNVLKRKAVQHVTATYNDVLQSQFGQRIRTVVSSDPQVNAAERAAAFVGAEFDLLTDIPLVGEGVSIAFPEINMAASLYDDVVDNSGDIKPIKEILSGDTVRDVGFAVLSKYGGEEVQKITKGYRQIQQVSRVVGDTQRIIDHMDVKPINNSASAVLQLGQEKIKNMEAPIRSYIHHNHQIATDSLNPATATIGNVHEHRKAYEEYLEEDSVKQMMEQAEQEKHHEVIGASRNRHGAIQTPFAIDMGSVQSDLDAIVKFGAYGAPSQSDYYPPDFGQYLNQGERFI